MLKNVVLLDTGIANIRSVANMLEHIGAEFEISKESSAIAKANKIVFPGVGTFGVAMEKITANGLVEPIRRALLQDKKPCLGICVGMQVLADVGLEFGEHKGLG